MIPQEQAVSLRWVRYMLPETDFERAILGDAPFVISEAPKGVGCEVRLATEQETGLFARLALAAGSAERPERGTSDRA